jgi:chromosome partitioning protein
MFWQSSPARAAYATALAVRASQGSRRVALFDADPQGSFLLWWKLRGEPLAPDASEVFEVDKVGRDVASARAQEWDWVIVDAPPSNLDLIPPIVRTADFVLVSCRVSALDLDALQPVIDTCKRLSKPFAFILTQVSPQWEKFTASARKALQGKGDVLDEQLRSRLAHASALTVGKAKARIADRQRTAPP